jgi:hypothetical protein
MFAQVTNPPIDPIREAIVMSLVSFIGPKPNLLDINQVNPPMRLELQQPVLDFEGMAKLRDIEKHTNGKFKSSTIDITYPLSWGKQGVEAKLASLCAHAVDEIKGGANILIISDRNMSATQVAIPALLALSAIHQHLVREGLRTTAGLVVETGTAREVHHFAVLAGYGAEAVHPYLAMETLVDIFSREAAHHCRQGHLSLCQGHRQGPVQDHVQDGRVHLYVLLRRPAVRGRGPEQRDRGQVLHRHGQPCGRHRRVRDRRGNHPQPRGRLQRRPGAGNHAGCRRRVRLARPWRRAYVDA